MVAENQSSMDAISDIIWIQMPLAGYQTNLSCYQTNTGVGEKNGKGAINPSSNKLDQQIKMYPGSIKSM